MAVLIDLSDDEILTMRVEAARQGFPNVEEYLRELVTHDVQLQRQIEAIGPPDELRVTTKEQLQEMILEGLQTPAREMTKADFDEMRRELIQRYRQLKT